ncbi:MAG: hypothetical protein WAL73_21305, partial [Terracidiphilus sp.]
VRKPLARGRATRPNADARKRGIQWISEAFQIQQLRGRMEQYFFYTLVFRKMPDQQLPGWEPRRICVSIPDQ